MQKYNYPPSRKTHPAVAFIFHKITCSEWQEAQKYFSFSCAYCGDSESDLSKDHVIPLSKGGSEYTNNIVPCCKSCNCSKRDKELVEWMMEKHFSDNKRHERLEKVFNYINNVGKNTWKG